MKSYLETLISQQRQLISQQAYLIEINRQLLAEVMALAPQDGGKPIAPESPASEKLYNRKEAADFLLVHPRSVTRYRISGTLRAVHEDGDEKQIRYREADLMACYFWKWGRWP